MSSDELEKLAEEGRAQKAAADAREREGKDEEARARQQEYRSVLFSSLSSYVRWGWFVAATPLVAALALVTAKLLPEVAFARVDEEEGWGVLVTVTASLAGFLVTWLLRPWAGRRALAKEEAWVASLPFRVENYFQTLEGRANDGELTLTLNYEDTRPKELEFISDVFQASGGTVTQHQREDRVSMKWDWESSASTNHHVVEWLHRVAPTLLALHAKWRLKSVHVKASWT